MRPSCKRVPRRLKVLLRPAMRQRSQNAFFWLGLTMDFATKRGDRERTRLARALYASLVQAGAAPPKGSPSASDAATFAKRILLAWADHGFRDEKGAFRRTEEGYCDLNPDGKPHVTGLGTFNGALTH